MSNLSKAAVLSLLFAEISQVEANQRTFTFTNKCSYPVWLGFAAGSANARGSSSTSCNSSGDCYEGSSCVQTGDIRQCFWNNPAPSDGNFQVASGSRKDVNIPIYDNGSNIIWSGAIGGRTNCNSGSCETADCGLGDKGCKPSQGMQQPATQAEFTLLRSDIDYYDVEIINGVNIPISMGPSNTAAAGSNDPYNCGTPGAKSPSPGMASCSWNFSPPSNDYVWVTAGGNGCNSDGDCGGSQCGISFNPGHDNLLQKTCGRKLGYWSADQICGVIPSYGAPFNCNSRLPSPQDNLLNSNLFACNGPIGSCYQDGAQNNCCGCVNWDQVGVPVPSNPFTQLCKNQNQNWIDRALPTLKWMKQACPSAYTYPFDDMSSTFVCKNIQGGVNTVNYEVTFCPNNASNEENELFLA